MDEPSSCGVYSLASSTFRDVKTLLENPTHLVLSIPAFQTGAQSSLKRVCQAAANRLAIFATVARLQPVAACTIDHEEPPRSIDAIPSFRALSSNLPR